MNTILDKFTNHFKQVIYKAYRLAQSTPEKIIQPEHLLWGLLQQKGSVASELLRKFDLKVCLKSPTNYPLDHNPPMFTDTASFPLSPVSQRIIERSVMVAANHEHRYIGTEHLLWGLLDHPDEHIRSILKTQKIPLGKLYEQIESVLFTTSRFPELAETVNVHDDASREELQEIPIAETGSEEERAEEEYKSEKDAAKTLPRGSRRRKSKTPALEFFATDLTDDVIQQTIDPVIGREQEITRVIQILGRRTKNNPVLLGEPGVGKTAIVEGLAKRIKEKQVPDILLDKKIFNLDLTLLVAGTIYRGEFESRFKQVLDELKTNPNIILFIDEIHTIIGTGSGGGSLDAAQMLKPALARGEIRCVGATTRNEYKKYIEHDPALERRFQAVSVPEVSPDEAIEILSGIKTSYEQHHAVKVSEDAIRSAVLLSTRYIPEKYLPDKAIDLIDEAASRIKMSAPSSPRARHTRELERRLDNIRELKQQAVLNENFPEALKLKEREVLLVDQIVSESNDRIDRPWLGTVRERDVAAIVSGMTGVPLSQLTRTRSTPITKIESSLKKKIIGQNEALSEISSTLKRAHAGLAGHTRPLGSFIFLGPSGVGKTETAKILAAELFGSEDSLIRIDMSEFAESFNVSKLIGAPPGYIGYHEGGKLTESVRRQPYSLILFDEIEKAHPEVFNILLQVLDDGHLTDASGRRVNFKNTIIIMTSNIGLEQFNQSAALGFDSAVDKHDAPSFDDLKETALSEIRDTFRPEFLNRVDHITVFNPLSSREIARIAALRLNELNSRLAEQGIGLSWNNGVLSYIAKTSFSPNEGARGIRKLIEESIETPLAEMILKKQIKKGGKVKLNIKEKGIQLSAE